MSDTFSAVKAQEEALLCRSYSRYPVAVVRGKGSRLWDVDGKEYVDLLAGIAVTALGHCNDEVCAALEAQAHKLWHVSNLFYQEEQLELARLLLSPSHHGKAFFCNSGAEANEACIKLARRYMRKVKQRDAYEIITLGGCFHGRTFGAMTATGQPESAIQKGFGDLTPGFTYAEYNNLDAFKAAYVEGKTCAIMFEPVQGEGGVFPATDEFIQGIRKFCDEKGILMLLDEVQAGWGRCGDFMCYMTYGIKPDVVSMAKAMGGGMPIGGIACTDRVATAFGPGTHGSTYAGHPVSCAASLAVLRELKAGKWPENAKKVGDYFAAELAKMPHVVTVRHRGLFVGVVLEDGINAVEVKRHCIKNHFLVTAIGANIIRMVPPLTIREVDCDEAVVRLSKSINEVAEGK